MTNYVQDNGVGTAYAAFEKDAVVKFIFQSDTRQPVKLGRELWQKLRDIGNTHLVSFGDEYIYATMNKEEFDTVIIPLINSKEIKHVHIDRAVNL